MAERVSTSTPAGSPRPARPTGRGPGRVLVAVYGLFALAATARAAVQIATKFHEAPLAYLLSALAAMGVVEALVVAQVVVAVWHLATGGRPRELPTFIGYLVAILVILPLAGLLARLEPTRWGALIATVGCLVVPVLIVRLNQVWTGVG